MLLSRSKSNILITGIFLYGLVSFVTYKLLHYLSPHPSIPIQTTPTQLSLQPTLPPPPADQEPINIVLVGHGGAGHAGGNLADSIILLHLDPTNSKKALISIPRDLWILLQDSPHSQNHYKINTAFALSLDQLNQDINEAKNSLDPGNTNLIKQAVSTVTNLPIHFTLAINFNNFEKAIDSIGPLTVEVPHAINDQFYPVRGKELELCGFSPDEVTAMTATMSGFNLEKQFTCRYESVVYNPGPAVMNGQQALKFVRSRHSSVNGGDFNRSVRQQAVLTAIQSRLFSLDAFQNAAEFFKNLRESVTTDINANQALMIASSLVKLKDVPTTQIYLNTNNVFTSSQSPNGAYIVIPKAGQDNWTQVHQYIQSQLN